MKAVIQRVQEAYVTINDEVVAKINDGLLVLLGIVHDDNVATIAWMSSKIVNMRIFNDEHGLMNKSILDIGGDVILVSQFTLYGDAQKGNRPSFIKAAKPDIAIPIYENMIAQLSKDLGKPIQTGVFGADMKVGLVNDGPVTIVLEK
ncbi:MAG: D-aminoacyl-tRNA deacylase [Chitinophagaceae bacterium]|jgi:D-tyrosyl-tRNA(Tyr) deacylase|nr:D-aminoacyl-tRNA deacylase [Chitinophagaceae bacterium]